jgi:hypothetical protein
MLNAARGIEVVMRRETQRPVELLKGKREVCKLQQADSRDRKSGPMPKVLRLCTIRLFLSHQQAWSSGYDFCLTTQVFGYTEGSEFDSQGL